MPKMTDQQIIDRLNEWMGGPNAPPSISVGMVNVIAGLLEMPPDERVATYWACHEFFCDSCGRDLAPGDRCHCNNDE